uniref:Uncharacterized protein n=1 Tax=Rhizophora mucronata TaxID=61149 RepID=A0A2P2ITQ5_RHIMU
MQLHMAAMQDNMQIRMVKRENRHLN